jgi:hypothetical protein
MLTEEVENLLPLIQSGQASEEDIRKIMERIRIAIQDDPAKGKELSALFSQIKQATKTKLVPTEIKWIRVNNASLGIGHKPGGKVSFAALKKEGTSVVLTLLQENEGAAQIGQQVTLAGMEWIWFPFSASSPHVGDTIHQVHDLFQKISERLNAGKQIYIHCSAGIHRTGMITYGLLRSMGHKKSNALQLLQQLRDVTATQVGEERLVWGDQFGKSGV